MKVELSKVDLENMLGGRPVYEQWQLVKQMTCDTQQEFITKEKEEFHEKETQSVANKGGKDYNG